MNQYVFVSFILIVVMVFGCNQPEPSDIRVGASPNDSVSDETLDQSDGGLNACCGETYDGSYRSNGDSSMPLFGWPPPSASASYVLRGFREAQSYNVYTLGDFDNFLTYALDSTGYVERSYFSVPDGYALVTRLERIYDDGTIVANNRWSVNDSAVSEFSISEYFKKLFFAEPGLFRVVVFVVTPHSFNQTEEIVSQDEALDWLRAGYNVLPRSVAELPFTSEYNLTALIYQFEKRDNEDPKIVANSSLTGQRHLEAAGILNYIY